MFKSWELFCAVASSVVERRRIDCCSAGCGGSGLWAVRGATARGWAPAKINSSSTTQAALLLNLVVVPSSKAPLLICSKARQPC